MAKKRDMPAFQGAVEVEVGGKKYAGTYAVSRDGYPTIEVTSIWGSKGTQLGGMSPKELASLLLREIIGKGKPD